MTAPTTVRTTNPARPESRHSPQAVVRSIGKVGGGVVKSGTIPIAGGAAHSPITAPSTADATTTGAVSRCATSPTPRAVAPAIRSPA